MRFLRQYICYRALTVAYQQQKIWYNRDRNMKKVTDYLQELGLTEIEAEIYQGLLEIGPTTVKELSEHIGIKRITTHFNVESLINKGLVAQTMYGARRQITAEPPERLEYLIEKKEKEIFLLKNTFPEFITSIQHTLIKSKQQDKDVAIKYYQGKQGVQSVYNDVLKAKKLRAYVNATEISKVFPNNMELFIQTHNKRKDMYIWEIMDYSKNILDYANRMARGRYLYKFIPKSMNLSVVDYLIYDDKVAIVNIKENPTGLIISNKDYYENAKAIFNLVWEVLSK